MENQHATGAAVALREVSCPTSNLSVALVRQKVLSVLIAARRDLAPMELIEDLAPQSFREEETIRASVNALIAQGEIELTSRRLLHRKTDCTTQRQCENGSGTSSVLPNMIQGRAAVAGAGD